MYHFIVNPSSSSGGGSSLWKEIEKRLMAEQIPYLVYMTDGAGAAKRYAEEITKGGEDVTIIVCGGDGTMNEVANGIRDFSKVTLGCVPTGSSNDLVRDLDTTSDPFKTINAVLHPTNIVKMDIGKITHSEGDMNFAVSMGVGFDAAICYEVNNSSVKTVLNKLKLGKLSYLAISLKQLLGAKKVGATIILDDEKEIKVERLLFVTCMVHRYEGGGFMFCPDADYCDGYLDICVVGDISKPNILRILPSASKGKHLGNKGIDAYRAKKVLIKTERPMHVHCDGESVGLKDEVVVTQEDKQVNLILG